MKRVHYRCDMITIYLPLHYTSFRHRYVEKRKQIFVCINDVGYVYKFYVEFMLARKDALFRASSAEYFSSTKILFLQLYMWVIDASSRSLPYSTPTSHSPQTAQHMLRGCVVRRNEV